MRIPGLSLVGKFNDWVMGAKESESVTLVLYDRTLLWLTFGLAIVGFVMVTSASMPIGQRLADDPFLFAKRDAIYLGLAFGLSLVTLRVPMAVWQKFVSHDPPALYHDFFAMLMRVPEFVLEGDGLVAMQNARALQRMMNLMRG